MSRLLVEQYHKEVEKLISYGGARKETSIRTAFQRLLEEYCKKKDFILIPELDYKTPYGNVVYPDGTIKDALRLAWGYWESKDEYDNIDEEIIKKFDKGYPKDNILFEDSKIAVLYQAGREIARVSMKDADALDRIISAFIEYQRPEVRTFRDAIEKFKQDVPHLSDSLRELIDNQSENRNYITARDEFFNLCKIVINPDIAIEDIREMLIQHILTEDIFNTIFDETQFHRENNIARQLEEVIKTFFTRDTKHQFLDRVHHYYAAINAAAAGIANHHEKQKFLKIIYGTFYKAYSPKKADRLGVEFTPNEIVRFMIESADYLCYKHFGKLLSDKNVELLDPATGTGTYVTELIEYIPNDKLDYKYENEIHANEVAILPYYIANLNIEFTYKQKTGKYKEFKNICFVDTLDNMGFTYKDKQESMTFGLGLENQDRIINQNKRKISVIIGNPPYNANQMNENENNKNREYPEIDKRIKNTFIKNSTAQKTKVYDMYSRFYRWSMDRLGDEGIIAFITNRSFINSRTFDGFRKIAASEFDHIYIIDLGGDVRANPKLSGPKHNVFAIQTGVAIMFLVKTAENRIILREDEEDEFKYLKKSLKLTSVVKEPEVFYGDRKYISPKGCRIFYIRRPEMETAKDKLDFLSTIKIRDLIKDGSFEHIIPDKNNNWIELSDDNDWETMIPLANKETKLSKNKIDEKAVFKLFSTGIVTARDEWVYDFNLSNLSSKITYFISEYNKSLENYINSNNINDIGIVIKWSRNLKNILKRKIQIIHNDKNIIQSLKRPFFKLNFYFEKGLNDEIGYFKNLINNENQFVGINNNSEKFVCLSSDCVFDFASLINSGGQTQCLPLYRYTENGERIENITDWGLEQFTNHYQDEAITKEDIFNYVYGLLHNPEYRKKYEMNLKREFPRIPFYDEFRQWAEWGKKLMDLHINFETVEPYPLERNDLPWDKERSPKAKLSADKQYGIITLDEQTTLSGIPKEIWEYKLGNRSAVEWILDQYKEKTPKDSTIREKFNTYRFADYKEKVIDLIQRVTTVSIETMKIIIEMERNNV